MSARYKASSLGPRTRNLLAEYGYMPDIIKIEHQQIERYNVMGDMNTHFDIGPLRKVELYDADAAIALLVHYICGTADACLHLLDDALRVLKADSELAEQLRVALALGATALELYDIFIKQVP